ncbi:MAG: hypothetical protein KDK91_03250 [Gammaproteobacteria bacterium]|nr:hypothetical protein [Gammaproteobacteria bacterium]
MTHKHSAKNSSTTDTGNGHGRRLLTDTDIHAFFHKQLDEALSNQRLDTTPEAVSYVVDLLARFSRTDQLFQRSSGSYGLKPLALHYAEAVQSSTTQEREDALRKLGDVALFISGLFAQSLSRKLVDVDYYIAMGGGAYSCLANGAARRGREAVGAVFAELAQKFPGFVEALAEIGDATHLASDKDLLRSYEIWLRTGSPRAARLLGRAGILPVAHEYGLPKH